MNYLKIIHTVYRHRVAREVSLFKELETNYINIPVANVRQWQFEYFT